MQPDLTAADIERFWEKVDVRAPDECWEWQAGKQKGYGAFGLNGKMVRAHRVAYRIEHGHWPDLMLLHSCDNRPCVNHAHLKEGTQTDNMQDASRKGRVRNTPLPGAENGMAKLTDSQVMEILERIRRKEKSRDICLIYGVSFGLISHIKTGRAWRHIPRDPADTLRPDEKH